MKQCRINKAEHVRVKIRTEHHRIPQICRRCSPFWTCSSFPKLLYLQPSLQSYNSLADCPLQVHHAHFVTTLFQPLPFSNRYPFRSYHTTQEVHNVAQKPSLSADLHTSKRSSCTNTFEPRACRLRFSPCRQCRLSRRYCMTFRMISFRQYVADIEMAAQLGGVGSAAAIFPGTFRKNADGSYSGRLIGGPDRGEFYLYLPVRRLTFDS